MVRLSLGITIITFTLTELMPGDFIDALLPRAAPADCVVCRRGCAGTYAD